jgi:hypothetical protein
VDGWVANENTTSHTYLKDFVNQEELAAGEEIAHCPSCSLFITVIYNPVRHLPPLLSISLSAIEGSESAENSL